MSKKKLLHYSREPLDFATLEDREQGGDARTPFGKPNGLWFSVGDGADGWRRWCEAEDFALDALTHEAEIVLHKGAKILRLTNAEDIDTFTLQYGVPYRPETFPKEIQWHRLASDHDGIIIAPYCWQRRLHHPTSWYYGWDCASGCIWKMSAIAEVRNRSGSMRCERSAKRSLRRISASKPESRAAPRKWG